MQARETKDKHMSRFATFPTFCGVPSVSLDSPEIAKADVVVLGSPIDWRASYRGGERFGPKAIREAGNLPANMSRPHLRTGIDPSEVMSVIDAGDIAVAPGCLELDT